MQKIGIIIMLLGISCISNAQEGGIHFEKGLSWKQVLKKAKKEHKYIFVDCYATWCSPCKAMEKNVYPKDTVGNIMNASFVSIKVQCDTSKTDGEEIKARYADAHKIATDFHIRAYPSFLFFSPDGKIVHKGEGYQGPKHFITLAKEAMDPHGQYFTLLKNYQAGKRDYALIPHLATMADNFNDTALFSAISKDYIHNYLDYLPDSSFCTKTNLDLLIKYIDGLSSKDRIFSWFARHREIGDSIMQKKGISNDIIDYIIYKEEVKSSVDLAKKSGKAPDWKMIKNTIINKFGKANEALILTGKMRWYGFIKDWENYCQAAIEKIEIAGYAKNPTNPENRETLNSFAWEIFQHSSDKPKLETALSWSELSLNGLTDSSTHVGLYLDTKANILYKLDRKEEALALETKANKISPDNGDLKEALQKMKEGKPTW